MFLLISIYFGLFFASIVIIRRVENILSTFLLKNTTINNEKALNEYKSVVRRCMYISLALTIIRVSACCLSIVLFLYKGVFAGVSFIIFRLLLAEFGKEAIELEKKARRLYCTTSLVQKYKQISHTWVHKAFPIF